jgi:hypothetical protein
LELIAVFPYIDRAEVNQTEKQHAVAIDLLAKFNLDYVRLERQRDGYCVYYAWNAPIIAHNGSPPTVKRGKIRIAP